MKNLLFSIFLLFLLCISSHLSAAGLTDQPVPAFTGKIVNSKGEGVEYAALAIISNANGKQKVIAVATCNEKGGFSFLKIPKGKYIFQISCLGYMPGKYEIEINETKKDMGSFSINEGIELKGVEVSGMRSLVKSEVDKLVYDVENDPEAATSNTLQILNKVPFVQVDKISNRIKVMDSEDNFVITINGKKSLLMSESNQYVGKMLEAGRLKKIELVTSPDGKYFNKTAVINIVTKSPLSDGMVTQISVSGNNEASAGSSFDLTSKAGKFIYTFSYNYNCSDLYGSRTQTNMIDYKNSDYMFSESSVRNNPALSDTHTATVKASCDMSQLDLLTVNFNATLQNDLTNITSYNKYLNANNVLTREFRGNNRNKSDITTYVGGVDYQRSFKDKSERLLTATYKFDNRDDKIKYDRLTEALTGSSDSWEQTRNNLENFEQTAAVDFYNTLPNRNSYYFTTKYVNRHYGSDSWMTDMNAVPLSASQLDALNYTQQVASLRGNYSIRAKKIMFTADAAFEYTNDDIDYRSDNTSLTKEDKALLVNLRFTYRATNKSTFIFSMNKSNYRPDIMFLNPYEDKSVSGQISKGNPNLDSPKRYSSMLIYQFFLQKKFSLNSLISINYSDNWVQPYSYMDDNGILVNTYGNIGKNKSAYFSIGANYNPTARFGIEVSGRMARQEFEYSGYKNSYWDPFFLLSFNGTLWHGGYINGQLTYADPSWVLGSSMQSTRQHLNLQGLFRFSQKIGKNLQASVSAINPWEKYTNQTSEKNASDFYNIQKTTIRGRSVGLSLSYNFGHFNNAVKSARRAVRNADRSK